MTKLSTEQALGNSAAAYVAWRLAEAGCFVRPVADGTDVGIDLFCESTKVEESARTMTPYLHFFVQVKAGAQCAVNADERASISVDVDHLRYWDRQPAPTFIALLPQVRENEPIYIVDVADSRSAPTRDVGTQKTVTLSSTTVIRDRVDAHRFVAKDVPRAAAVVTRNNIGVVAQDPELTQGYVRFFHSLHIGSIAPWVDKILAQLQTTSAMTIIIAWRRGELASGAIADRQQRLLSASLGAWASLEMTQESFRHWEIFYAAALLAHVSEKFEQAASWYREAIGTIDNDQNLQPLSEAWLNDRKEVESCLSTAVAKQALPHDPRQFARQDAPPS